ncbi:hypothetical protein J7L05_03850 [bacterium]|nr:hypothetical protein [bacterium]
MSIENIRFEACCGLSPFLRNTNNPQHVLKCPWICLFLIFISAVISVGCSSNSATSVTPNEPVPDETLPIVSGENNQTSHVMLGAWTLEFNPETLELTTIPNREIQLHWNVTPYIPAPVYTVINFDPLTAILDVDTAITNTYDFDAYDIRIIVFTDNLGSRLKNADNWTGLYDIPGGADVNPFKAYSNTGVNRIFEGLSEHTQRFQLFFPDGFTDIEFAIDASYPSNCDEPFAIKNFKQSKDLFETVGSECTLSVDVYDWQQDVNSVQMYCPSITDEILVSFTEATAPSWTYTLVNNTGATAGNYIAYILATSEGSGTTTLYGEFSIVVKSSTGFGEITGEVLSPECPVTGFVDGETQDFTVTASNLPGGEPIVLYEIDMDYDGETFDVDAENTDGIFNGCGPYANPNCPDPIPVFYFVAFRATDANDPPNVEIFATCEIVVDSCCGLITGSVLQPSCPADGIVSGNPYDFLVTASSANHGDPITWYEADWDYDGETFDVDDANYNGEFENISFDNPNCPENIPVTYTVAFRATDSCNPPNVTVFATCDINVDTCCGPITGEIVAPSCPVTGIYNGQSVDFTVTATSDNGGNPIVSYQADWDYDGLFIVDAFNTDGIFEDVVFTNPNCPSTDPYTYTVAFRAVDVCNPPNNTIFATCNVIIEDCLGIFGNLKLTVNRDIPNDYGYPFDESGPWTLVWGPEQSAVQYAIYYDIDPTDGLQNDMQFVDATTELEFTVPAEHLPSNHFIEGLTYEIRARSEIDNPASEYDTCEPAFIAINGFETLTDEDNDGEGWFGNCERNVANYDHRFYVETSTETAHGDKHLRLPDYDGYTNRWIGITKQTWDVPDSDVRHLECSIYFDVEDGFQDEMFFGTCSTQPTYGWVTPSELEWSSVESTGDFTAYNLDSEDIRTFFDDVPTGNNSWRFSSDPHTYLWGGDLNLDGDPLDSYIAIQFLHLDEPTGTTARIDEIAIVIY